MSKNIYEEFLDIQDSFLQNNLESELDAIEQKLDVSHPSSRVMKNEKDIRSACRQVLREMLYQRETRFQVLKGFDILIKTLSRMGKESLQCKKELAEAGKTLYEKVGSDEEIKNSIEKVKNLQNEKQPQKIIPFMYEIGISDDSFQLMYNAAGLLFSEENYADASSVYHFLTFINAPCFQVWYSMGLCYQKLQKWPRAIASYSTAIIADSFNVHSYIALLECYVAVSDVENATYTARCAQYIVNHSDYNQKEKSMFIKKIKKLKERL